MDVDNRAYSQISDSWLGIYAKYPFFVFYPKEV